MNKKILFTTFIAVLFVLSIFIAVPVNAEQVQVNEAKVDTLTGGTITKNDDQKQVTITFTAEEINDLKWYSKDEPTYQEGVTRPGNGWWLGFKLTLPESVTPSKVTRDFTNVFGATDSKAFNADDEAENVCSYWLGIDENRLNGKTEEFTLGTYKFHWDNKETVDLTVIIKVDPEGVKLTKDPDKMVTVKVGDTIFTIEKGKNLTTDKDKGGLTEQEAEKLNNLLKPKEGYVYVGLFDVKAQKVFELKQAVTEDLELEVRFAKENSGDVNQNTPPTDTPAETPTEQPTKKDTTPKTGSINFELIFSGMAMISLVTAVIIKKYSK